MTLGSVEDFVPKHHSIPIPDDGSIPSGVRETLENNRMAEVEEIEDVRRTMRDMREDMHSVAIGLRRLETTVTDARDASREAVGYCRAIAERFLVQHGDALPPMREKVETLRDIVTEAVAEATGPHPEQKTISDRVKDAMQSERLKEDGETWGAIKRSARKGTMDAVRKAIGVLLLLAAGWAAGHIERAYTAPSVAPAAK